MILLYFFSYIKKQAVNFWFPSIYLIPIFILIFINSISAFGPTYQKYTFHKNSNFICLRDTSKYTDMAFMPYTINLKANYDEELSVNGTPFYHANINTTIYFYQEPEALSVSYFTDKNLLSGSLPNPENLKKAQEGGAFPICITYDTAKDSKCGIGDILDLYGIAQVYGEDGQFHEMPYRYHFRITGILRPDGTEKSDAGDVDKISARSCALVDAEFMHKLPALFTFSSANYFVFSDRHEAGTLEGQNDTITLDEMKKSILKSLYEPSTYIFLGSVLLLTVALCSVTHVLLKARIAADLEILGKMGLSRNKASMIHFLRSFTLLLSSLLAAGLLVRFIYLPLIKKQYYDVPFIGGIVVFLLSVGGLVCLANAFLLRQRKR